MTFHKTPENVLGHVDNKYIYLIIKTCLHDISLKHLVHKSASIWHKNCKLRKYKIMLITIRRFLITIDPRA